MSENFKKMHFNIFILTKFNGINVTHSDARKYICYKNSINSLILGIQDGTKGCGYIKCYR